MTPEVTPFFDEATNSWSYVVHAPGHSTCAVIDPVLDYNPASGRIGTSVLDAISAHIRGHELEVQWVLDTHVHADHLSAARAVQQRHGGRLGIGAQVVVVQELFAQRFAAEESFARDGSQFDCLFADGDTLEVGPLEARVLHTPGHTPGCVTYAFDGAAFIGDTLFAPDYGSARCDFPGGDAVALYRSIQALYALPDETLLYLCHDYLPDSGRDQQQCAHRVAEHKRDNVHCQADTAEQDFVAVRQERDMGLGTPTRQIPAVQFNMRGAQLPPVHSNGVHYFQVPVQQPEGLDLGPS